MEFTYTGLHATLERVRVTDAEIDRQLERLQQQNPCVQVVTDRPAQEGDELLLDYAGFCGGTQFEGGTAERQTLTLGSGMFIPGFEEQLIGAKPGEDVTVLVRFPDEYHAKELAGKAAEFRCHVHEIRKSTLYELGDTFAREAFGLQNYEILRAKVASDLQGYYDAQSEDEVYQKLLRQAAMTLDDTPTEAELAEAIDEQIENLRAQLAQRGLSLEAYCRFTGSTEDQLRSDAKADAEQALRSRKTVERIAELEGIRADEQELAQQMELICRHNHMTMEELRPYLDDTFCAAVDRSVVTGKVLRLLRDRAVVTVVDAKPIA